jgi:hypothetical protein
VKPIHLNLAARPYRDYRPVYLVVVAASLLTFGLGLYNVDTFIHYQSETVSTRATIDKLNADAARQERLAEDANRRLKTVNVSALEKQTRFVNAQIAERAFSWSELLDRLEAVLANNTRITQISPSFDKNEKNAKSGATIHLELNCEAKTSSGMVEMLNRFNNDQHFSSPFPRVLSATPNGFLFAIGVEYKPSAPKVSP